MIRPCLSLAGCRYALTCFLFFQMSVVQASMMVALKEKFLHHLWPFSISSKMATVRYLS